MTRGFLFSALAILALALPAYAADPDPVQQHNTNAVWFENWIGLENAMMRVADPEGEIVDVRAKTGTPVYQLKAPVLDGVYRYELRAASDEMVKNRNKDRQTVDGEEPPEYVNKPFYRTGYFVVKGGVIITPEQVEEGAGD